MPELDSTLHQRLQVIAEDRTQAEIARKTGFPQANVHRFLNGRRVPAEFCEALSRAYKVNPTWLLLGEGAPYLSDVAAPVAKMGEGILELVRALSAVEHMRLGSLTGKHHLRVLRELNDALVQEQQLRKRLDEQSRPIFHDLLAQLTKRLNAGELDHAEDLMRAAEQVSKLCSDEDLLWALEGLRSYHAYLVRDFEKTLRLQRRLFVRRWAHEEGLGTATAERAHNLVMSLIATHRLKEALRVAEAGLAIGEPGAATWRTDLGIIIGALQMDLGDLTKGLARMQSSGPEASGRCSERFSGFLVRGLLWGGFVQFRTAFDIGAELRGKCGQLLAFATWREDEQMLARAIEECISDDPNDLKRKVPSTNLEAVHARATLIAMQSGKPAVRWLEDELKKLPKGLRMRACDLFQEQAVRVHIAELTATPAPIRRQILKAIELRETLPDEFTPAFEFDAHVQRAILRHRTHKDIERYRRTAHDWFERMQSHGFATLTIE